MKFRVVKKEEQVEEQGIDEAVNKRKKKTILLNVALLVGSIIAVGGAYISGLNVGESTTLEAFGIGSDDDDDNEAYGLYEEYSTEEEE